jgi:hypothetical protein
MILTGGKLSLVTDMVHYLINHSIALAPPFAGLRRFPEGRNFKQWTGDDSKALMKVRNLFLLLQN